MRFIVVAFCVTSNLVDGYMDELPILISHTYWLTLPSCITGRPFGPARLLPIRIFFYILIQTLTTYIAPVIQLVKAF